MKNTWKRVLAVLLSLVFCAAFLNTAAFAKTTREDRDFDQGWKFHLGEASGAQGTTFDDSSWRNVNIPHDYSIEQEYTPKAQGESGYLPGGVGWYRKTFTVPAEDAGKHLVLGFDGVNMNSTVYLNGEKLGDHPYGYSPFSFDITPYVKVGQPNVLAVRTDNKLPSSRWYSGSGIFRDVTLTATDPVHVATGGIRTSTPNLSKDSKDGLTKVVTTVKNDGSADETIALRQTITGPGKTVKVKSAKFPLKKGQSLDVSMDLTVKNPKLWSPAEPNLYQLTTEVLKDGKAVDTVTTDIGYRWTTVSNTKGLFLNGKPFKVQGVCLHHDQGALGSAANRAAIERQLQIMKKMGCNAIRTSHNPASRTLIDLCNKEGFLVLEEMYDGWHANKNVNIHDFSESFYKTIPADSKLENSYPGEYWSEYSLKSTIRRDRNAPCIYMWDLGNEVEGAAAGVAYDRDYKNLAKWADEVDGTRSYVTADSLLKYYDKVEVPDHTNMAKMQTASGGQVGGNYVHGNVWDTIHERHPDWPLIASEDVSAVNSRGVYKRGAYDTVANGTMRSDSSASNKSGDQLPKHQLTAYDESTVSWGKMAAEGWYDSITRDYLAGEYVWTGFDYIGEPTPWNSEVSIPIKGWPAPKSSYFGIVDLAGFPKDSYYFYQSQWNHDLTTLHVLPAWNENVVDKDENGNVKVVVYSNAKSVELFFTPKNGGKKVSLGKKTYTTKKSDGGLYSYQYYEGPGKSDKDYENLYMTWNVPYQDGTLTAVAYDKDGKVIKDTDGRNSVTTAGPAAELKAEVYGGRKSIATDGNDLAYIEVTVTDKDGIMVPDAANRIYVTVNGKPARLVGVDNGDASDIQSFHDNNRKAFNGKFLAIVQSTGEKGSFTVTVSSDGLKGDTVKLSAK